MRDNMVYEEYSDNKEYKFEVYKEKTYFETRVQKRITEECLGSDWFDYRDILDYKHIADSLDRAIEIGRECLQNLI